MRSILTFIGALIFSVSAFANVSGKWKGWVYWSFQGHSTKCFSTLELEETANKLHRKGGAIECDFTRMDILEQIFTKVGPILTSEGTEVGTWSEDYFNWTEKYSDDVTIYNEISVKGNSMDYHEKWLHQSGKEIYDIKGRFFRP